MLPAGEKGTAVHMVNQTPSLFTVDVGQEVGQANMAADVSHSVVAAPSGENSPCSMAAIDSAPSELVVHRSKEEELVQDLLMPLWEDYAPLLPPVGDMPAEPTGPEYRCAGLSERSLFPPDIVTTSPGNKSPATQQVESTIRQEGGNAHLLPIIESLPPELSEEEQKNAVDFLQQYSSVFSRSEFDLGRTPLIEHHIDTGDAKPFRQGLCRHPQAYLDVIDSEISKMEAAGVMEAASSP